MATSKKTDNIKFSEITAILQEEGFLAPEVLTAQNTFGQARGVAGRKRTKIIKRLTELGFVEAEPGTGNVAGKQEVTVRCHVLIIGAVPIVYCYVEFTIKNDPK
jgi:hypothetical protein